MTDKPIQMLSNYIQEYKGLTLEELRKLLGDEDFDPAKELFTPQSQAFYKKWRNILIQSLKIAGINKDPEDLDPNDIPLDDEDLINALKAYSEFRTIKQPWTNDPGNKTYVIHTDIRFSKFDVIIYDWSVFKSDNNK